MTIVPDTQEVEAVGWCERRGAMAEMSATWEAELLRTLRLEDYKFEMSLGNLARPCQSKKILKSAGDITQW